MGEWHSDLGQQAVQGYALIPSKGGMAGGLMGTVKLGWWSDVLKKVGRGPGN